MRKNLPSWAKFIILGGLILFLAGGWGMLIRQKEKEAALPVNKSNYVRLHILANSNSPEDQNIKIKVKDAVVNYLTPFLKDADSVLEAQEIIKKRKEDILRVAGEVIAADETKRGHYPVTMETGNFDFPVKSYGALVLPEGRYQAVRLLIGEGKGENWWCVLFPPLCFIDGVAKEPEALIKKEETEQKNEPEVKIRWRIIELFKS